MNTEADTAEQPSTDPLRVCLSARRRKWKTFENVLAAVMCPALIVLLAMLTEDSPPYWNYVLAILSVVAVLFVPFLIFETRRLSTIFEVDEHGVVMRRNGRVIDEFNWDDFQGIYEIRPLLFAIDGRRKPFPIQFGIWRPTYDDLCTIFERAGIEPDDVDLPGRWRYRLGVPKIYLYRARLNTPSRRDRQ